MYLTQKIPTDGTQKGGGWVLLKKKQFWNNIGKCRFKVQKYRKSGTLEDLNNGIRMSISSRLKRTLE